MLLPRKESDILRPVLDYLAVRKVFHFRVNNAGIFDGKRQIFRKPVNLTPGVSDVICLKWNRLLNETRTIFLETKATRGKQSPEQIKFEKDVKANGGEYYIIRSVQDVINVGL